MQLDVLFDLDVPPGSEIGGLLVFDWEGSPLRISVQVEEAGEEGPIAIEVVPRNSTDGIDETIAPLGCRLIAVAA